MLFKKTKNKKCPPKGRLETVNTPSGVIPVQAGIYGSPQETAAKARVAAV